MPFCYTKDGRSADYWTNFFDHFLKPALADCGFRAKRSEATSENIVANIMEDLALADLVVAVLTDFNANVWYELGVRHAVRRGRTVMICQDDQISLLPFDLKHHGVSLYSPSLDRRSFTEGLEKQLAGLHDDTKDSPVSDFVNLGLAYCISRALACLRIAMEQLKRCADLKDDTLPLKLVDQLNGEWRNREVQVTVVQEGKILRHRGEVPPGSDALLCWQDMSMKGQPLYPLMKSNGHGLRLAAIRDCIGRITAIAFDTIPERGWLIVVEAHINQGGL